MPRLDNAIERVVDRMMAVYERDLALYEEEYGPKPEDLRADYEQAIDLEMAGQPGIAEFIAAHGEEAWNRQVTLALRRAQRKL